MEQLVMALRSTYSQSPNGENAVYGFQHEDEGAGARSSDRICWVKLGGALIGKDNPLSGSPHRVEFFVTKDKKSRGVAAARAWGMLTMDDFDPEEVEPVVLSSHVQGFDCRVSTGELDENDAIEWEDEWEDTNRIPHYVEVTLFMDPLAEDESPVEIKRVIEIPIKIGSPVQKKTP
jgi:hypothetical protein